MASEYLIKDGYELDHETLRRWLLSAGVWKPRRKRKQHRQWRERRVDAIQVSPFHWRRVRERPLRQGTGRDALAPICQPVVHIVDPVLIDAVRRTERHARALALGIGILRPETDTMVGPLHKVRRRKHAILLTAKSDVPAQIIRPIKIDPPVFPDTGFRIGRKML